MIKIGIVGIGRIGAVHIENIINSKYFELVGCVDLENDNIERIIEDYDVKIFDDIDTLIEQCDAIDIVSNADTHLYICEKVLKKSKHLFIDKPLANKLSDAKKIVDLATEAGIKIQIGYIERFNPAFVSLKNKIIQPNFIESYRAMPFDTHKSDISVVFDLMLHDIDIVLNMVNANIKNIAANGVMAVSNQIDFANARIEFDNGCVANLTANRMTLQRIKKLNLLENNQHYCLDFLNRTTEYSTFADVAGNNHFPIKIENKIKYLNTQIFDIEEYDVMKEQLESFALSIINNTTPKVTIEDGYFSLEVAHIIMEKINKTNGF